MGVFKNEVGRPSNEVIKKRRILKCIIAVLVIIICLLVGYIVNDKLDKNKGNNINKEITENNNKIEEKDNNNDVKKEEIKNRYEKLSFSRNKEEVSGYVYLNQDDFVDFEVKLIDGKVECYKGEKKEKVSVKGINSKIKYIDGYTNEQYGPYVITPIALSENGELYIGEYYIDTNTVEFKLISSNIKEILLTNDVADLKRLNGAIENRIYALTNDEKLLHVKYNEKKLEWFLSDEKYEDAYLYVGNYHDGFTAYNSVIRLSDNNLNFYFKNQDFVPVKFDNENVIVKDIYIYINYDKDINNPEHFIYIIDKNNNLLTNKGRYVGEEPDELCGECYELKKVSEFKVKEYKIRKEVEGYTEKQFLDVTFEDGTKKEIRIH